MTVTQLYKSVKAFDTKREGVKAIEKTKDRAVEYNREQLYLRSQRSDGTYLQSYRDLDFYAAYKNRRNPAPGFGSPDLYDTGAFQNRMYAIVRGDRLFFDSRDRKTGMLVERYGSHIFGLTKDSEDNYATKDVRSEVLKSFERKTGLMAK